MIALKRPIQLSLLALATGGGRAAPPPPRRFQLDATSWVDHLPHWYPTAPALFDLLAEGAAWEQRTRRMYDQTVLEPRLTAEYPVLAEAPFAELRDLGRVLSSHYEVPYDRAWLNLYRDHRDSTSWHSDRPCVRPECIVPVLSLGETRRFLLRPKAGGRSTALVVEGGDLVVMGGRCQGDWVHAVPKEARAAGARISINFASRVQALPG